MAAGQNQDIIYLLAETGLRSGEMAGLMIDDLDFIKNTISIRRSVDRTLSLVGTPKTKASRRTLHGSPYLMNLLHSYVAGRSQGYVFHSKNHDWVTPDTVLYQFRLALRQVGLDPDSYNLHTLRHFNTSLMASIGIPLKIAKERLGHSVRGDITLGTYTHSFTDDEIGAAAKIHGALVGEPKSEGTMASDLAQDLRQLAAKHGLRIEDVVGRLTAVMDN
jgi:integrase